MKTVPQPPLSARPFGDKWSLLVMRDLLLLEMMLWSATHDPHTGAPAVLIAELKQEQARAARAIRERGGIVAFLASL